MSLAAPDLPPPGRPALAQQYVAVFGPPPATTAPVYQSISVIAPDRLTPVPALAAYMPYLFRPTKLAVATVTQRIQPIVPYRVWSHPPRAHEYPYLFKPALKVAPVAPAIPGVGTLGAATFVLSLSDGLRVVYSWPTDVFRSYSGREQRSSPADARPRIRIEGTAFMLDAKDRDMRGTLMRAASQGSTFTLALPFEAQVLASDSVGTTCNVVSTAQCDWAQPGQRCIVIARDASSTALGIIQSATATTIAIAVVDSTGHVTSSTLGNTGLAGGQIMPLLQVVLDPVQGFARYPAAVGLWNIRATAVAFGWAGTDSMGIGTSITTFTQQASIPVASLVDADLLIWDRINEVTGTATETAMSGAELVDLGGLAYAAGAMAAPDWQTPLRMRSSYLDDWAYTKAFLRQLRGRQRSFGLPTNRADLTFLRVATNGSGIVVASSAVTGGGDYVGWFASGAYRRLALTLADGSVQYVTVLSVADNGAGEITLTLQGGFSGVVAKISLLEQVRIDNDDTDDIAISWTGPTFTLDVTTRASQDSLSPPLKQLFDTVIEVIEPSGLPTTVGLSGAIGQITIFNIQGFGKSINGITATGGNVDGMVVCCCNVNTSTNGYTFLHEDSSATAENRLRNSGGAAIGSLGLAIWYRYNATMQRWVQFLQN